MLPGGQLPCHRACQEGLQWRVRRAAHLYSAEPGRMAGPERDREKDWNCQEGQRAEDSWKSLGVNTTFMPTSSVYKKEQTSKPARRKWEKGNDSLRGPNCANS